MFATEYNINYTNLPWLVSASISFLHFFVSDRRANQQGENRNHTAYKITVNYLPMTKMEDSLDTRVFWGKKNHSLRAECCWWWSPLIGRESQKIKYSGIWTRILMQLFVCNCISASLKKLHYNSMGGEINGYLQPISFELLCGENCAFLLVFIPNP